jgi:transcriptional regulator with XRE-family HTH domain
VRHTSLRIIGSNVRALRVERGLSQEQLAELADLHRNYISGIECGERNVSALNICKLADALGADIAALFSGVAKNARSLASRKSRRA